MAIEHFSVSKQPQSSSVEPSTPTKRISLGTIATLTIMVAAICLYPCNRCSADNPARAGRKETPSKVANQGRYHNHSASIRSNDKLLEAQLGSTVDLSALELNTTFSQAIDILRKSTQPPLNIVVFWRDLQQNSLVEPTTPILMRGVSGIPLEKGLELILRSVSSYPGELGYVVEDGVVVIATRSSLPTRFVTRIYDITDLVSLPANFTAWLPPYPYYQPGMTGAGLWSYPGGFGGVRSGYGVGIRRPAYSSFSYNTMQSRRAAELTGLIRNSIRPRSWR